MKYHLSDHLDMINRMDMLIGRNFENFLFIDNILAKHRYFTDVSAISLIYSGATSALLHFSLF